MRWVAMVVTCMVPAAGHADEAITLEPANLTVALAPSWKIVEGSGGDDLLRDKSDERTIEISFERRVRSCRVFKPASDRRKEFPAYWPKRARTHLYTQKTGGKLIASGCLANALPKGSVIANIEITAGDAAWQPSESDVALIHTTLLAVQAAALGQAPPLPAAEAEPAVVEAKPEAVEPKPAPEAKVMPEPKPAPEPKELEPNAHRGGTTVTLPSLELSVKLPRGATWIVGERYEAKIERDDASAPTLAVTAFATAFRTCGEWRTDASTDASVFAAQPEYLPSTATHGAFVLASELHSTITACVETKQGPLGLALRYARPSAPHTLDGADAAVMRGLVAAIVKGANQQRDPLYIGKPPLDGGTVATAAIGKVKLPAGAQWRVSAEAIERFDKGRYFTLALRSRPSCATSGAEQAFLPAGIKATVETRAWGATVVKACLHTTRAIEATLAYDGGIVAADHALIRALFEAVLASKPK